MTAKPIPFFRSLGGRMFLLGIVPMGLVLSVVVIVAALQMAAALRGTSEDTLRVLADRVGTEIERGKRWSLAD